MKLSWSHKCNWKLRFSFETVSNALSCSPLWPTDRVNRTTQLRFLSQVRCDVESISKNHDSSYTQKRVKQLVFGFTAGHIANQSKISCRPFYWEVPIKKFSMQNSQLKLVSKSQGETGHRKWVQLKVFVRWFASFYWLVSLIFLPNRIESFTFKLLT